MTKNNILILSLSGTILVVLLGVLGMESCYRNTTCKMFRDLLSFESFSSSILFLPLFIFSLITYRMRDEIFETWVKFALWWTSATVILVLLAPANAPSLLPITKSVIALATTTITYKWNINKYGEYTMLAAHLKTGSTTIETHYRPKKNTTIIMQKPTDLDDSDNDDDVDVRLVKTRVPGMAVVGMTTKEGVVEVGY